MVVATASIALSVFTNRNIMDSTIGKSKQNNNNNDNKTKHMVIATASVTLSVFTNRNIMDTTLAKTKQQQQQNKIHVGRYSKHRLACIHEEEYKLWTIP